MEGCSRIPLAVISPFTSEPCDFTEALEVLITRFYEMDFSPFSKSVSKLNELRQSVLTTVNSPAITKQYLCQLNFLRGRFKQENVDPDSFPLEFVWTNPVSRQNYASSEIEFEMAVLFYNIGCQYSSLGAQEERTTPDSLKVACTHYLCAAWCFQAIVEVIGTANSPVAADALQILQTLMLSQAQQCILEKSFLDHRNSVAVAKIAVQICDYYAQCDRLSGQLSGPKLYSGNINGVLRQSRLQFLQSYYDAVSVIERGRAANDSQRYGEAVSLFQAAVAKLERCNKIVDRDWGYRDALAFTSDVAQGLYQAAVRDNEHIYHERVPSFESLEQVKGACLVKAIGFDLTDPELAGTDLFASLVPLAVTTATSVYTEEKAKLLREVTSQVEVKTKELDEFLAAVTPDLALFDSTSLDNLPPELIELCAALSVDKTVAHKLVGLMQQLASAANSFTDNVDEISAIIEAITADKEGISELNLKEAVSFNEPLAKAKTAHEMATVSNAELHRAMALQRDYFDLMSKPIEEVRRALPSVQAAVDACDRTVVDRLRYVVGKVEEMRQQRGQLETQLRQLMSSDDITSKVVASSSEPNKVQDLFKKEMTKFDPVVDLINQNLAAQQNILAALTDANANFAELRNSVQIMTERRQAHVQVLLDSLETTEELLAKASKGIGFYQRLNNFAETLLADIRKLHEKCKEEQAKAKQVEQEKEKQQKRTASIRFEDVSMDEVGAMADVGGPIGDISGGCLKDYLPFLKPKSFGGARAERRAARQAGLQPGFGGGYQNPYLPPQPTQQWAGQHVASTSPQPGAFQNMGPVAGYVSPSVAAPQQQNVVQPQFQQQVSSFLPPQPVQQQQQRISPVPPSNYQQVMYQPQGPPPVTRVSQTQPCPPPNQQQQFQGYSNFQGQYQVPPPVGYNQVNQQQPVQFQGSQNFQPQTNQTGYLTQNAQPTGFPAGYNQLNQTPSFQQGFQQSNQGQQYPSSNYVSPNMVPQQQTRQGDQFVSQGPMSQNLQPNQNLAVPQQQQFPQHLTPVQPTVQNQGAYGYQPVQQPFQTQPIQPVMQATFQPQQGVQQSTFHQAPVQQSGYVNSQQQVPGIQSQPVHQMQQRVNQNPQGFQSYEMVPVTNQPQQISYQPQQQQQLQSTGGVNLQSLGQNQVPTRSSLPGMNMTPNQPYVASQPQQNRSSLPGMMPNQNQGQVASFPIQQQPQQVQHYNQQMQPRQFGQPQPRQPRRDLMDEPIAADAPVPPPLIAFSQQTKQAPESDVSLESSKLPQPIQPNGHNVVEPSVKPVPVPALPTTPNAVKNVAMVQPYNKEPVVVTPDKDKKLVVEVAVQPVQPNVDSTKKVPPSSPFESDWKWENVRQGNETLMRHLREEALRLDTLIGVLDQSPTHLDRDLKGLVEHQERECARLTCSVAKCSPVSQNLSMDCLPYDFNRVKLVPIRPAKPVLITGSSPPPNRSNASTETNEDDYINASHIDFNLDGSQVPKFIATQGPTSNTLTKFWQTVWQENVETIVTLLDGDAFSSFGLVQFWPAHQSTPIRFGDFEIQLKTVKDCGKSDQTGPHWRERVLAVTCLTPPRMTRVILQLNFRAWPSLKSPSLVVEFIHAVRYAWALQRNRQLHQVLVHCSNGSGWTGVFLSTFWLLSEIDMAAKTNSDNLPVPSPFDLVNYVRRLRSQRRGCVQERQQLRHLYDVFSTSLHHVIGDASIETSHVTDVPAIFKSQGSSGKSTDTVTAELVAATATVSDIEHLLSGLTFPTPQKKQQERVEDSQQQSVTVVQPIKSPQPPAKPVINLSASPIASVLEDPNLFSMDDPDDASNNNKKITKANFMKRLSDLGQDSMPPPTSDGDPLGDLDPMWKLRSNSKSQQQTS